MKIYLVNKDNGESYEDYDHQVVAAFTTFRLASQYLLKDGYIPYIHYEYMTKEPNVRFRWESEDEDGWEEHSEAKIIEMELQG